METVFDPLRKISVPLTPEEAVRQNVIAWLHESRNIPYPMMMSEYAFTYNRMRCRADIVVFSKNLSPLMLVECKAPDVKIGRKAAEQAARYDKVLNVKYILITNGRESYFCERSEDGTGYRFLKEIPDIKLD